MANNNYCADYNIDQLPVLASNGVTSIYMYLLACLPVFCLSACLFYHCQPVSSSVCQSVCVHLSVCLSVRDYIMWWLMDSVGQRYMYNSIDRQYMFWLMAFFVCPPVFLFICKSIIMSTCPFVHLYAIC